MIVRKYIGENGNKIEFNVTQDPLLCVQIFEGTEILTIHLSHEDAVDLKECLYTFCRELEPKKDRVSG